MSNCSLWFGPQKLALPKFKDVDNDEHHLLFFLTKHLHRSILAKEKLGFPVLWPIEVTLTNPRVLGSDSVGIRY